MPCFVYIIGSFKEDKLTTYVGWTNDIDERLNKHNSNKGAKATKGYKWKIIFKKKFSSKNKAMSYEYLLKKNRKMRSTILKQSNNEK